MAEMFAGFDRPSVERIVKTVQTVERQPPSTPRQGGSSPDPTPGFWIELTDEGTAGPPDKTGWYSWKLVYPTATAWADADPAVTGTLNARDTNAATGLYDVSTSRRYFATFNGYDGDGNAVYLFTAVFSPPLIKITGNTTPVSLGPGKYWGRVQKRTATAFAVNTTGYSNSTYYTDVSATPVMVVNNIESGAADHALKTNSYHRCIKVGTATSGATTYDVYEILGPGISYAC